VPLLLLSASALDASCTATCSSAAAVKACPFGLLQHDTEKKHDVCGAVGITVAAVCQVYMMQHMRRTSERWQPARLVYLLAENAGP
jgi:hypothetical protein